METNVKDFLKNIEELNKNKFETVRISGGDKISCSLLSFKQQKELLSSAVDGIVGVIKFQKILNDILLENTESNLSVSDKLPIILKLRSESIGNTVKVNDTDINLNKIIKKAESMKFTMEETITDSVELSLKIPSLQEENQVLKFAIEQLKKNSDNNSKNLGNIYTYEIVKYVDTVKLGDTVVKFSDISVGDRIKIIENLPLSINKKIVKFIEKNKKIENDVLKAEINGEEFIVDIDISFFDN